MTEKVTRRRRRRLLVPLLGVGVAAWLVKRRLDDGQRLDEGWHELPPAPRPVPTGEPARSGPVRLEPARPEPAAEVAPEPVAVPPKPSPPKPSPVKPSPHKPAPPAAMPPAPAPVAPASVATASVAPASVATASVAAPALPEAPYGPGSVRAMDDGTSPQPDFTVKGKTATKVFHAPGGAYYTRTRADVWFRTADDAQAAGFTERGPRRHR